MNHPHRYLACLALLCSLAAVAPVPAAAQPAEQCFTETGQCISGRFLEVWTRSGGLVTYGFPITPARQELNRDTGETYLTQWFERNRFELHPANAAPNDVLLGRLGDDRLRQRGTDWTTLPKADGPRDGCQFFPETSHNLCNQAEGRGFLAYWRNAGQTAPGQSPLALYGLPLSEPTMETNAAGDTVLTQWFERARLEWHAGLNNGAGGVLLGLLGREVLDGNTAPAPAGTADASPYDGYWMGNPPTLRMLALFVRGGKVRYVRWRPHPTPGCFDRDEIKYFTDETAPDVRGGLIKVDADDVVILGSFKSFDRLDGKDTSVWVRSCRRRGSEPLTMSKVVPGEPIARLDGTWRGKTDLSDVEFTFDVRNGAVNDVVVELNTRNSCRVRQVGSTPIAHNMAEVNFTGEGHGVMIIGFSSSTTATGHFRVGAMDGGATCPPNPRVLFALTATRVSG